MKYSYPGFGKERYWQQNYHLVVNSLVRKKKNFDSVFLDNSVRCTCHSYSSKNILLKHSLKTKNFTQEQTKVRAHANTPAQRHTGSESESLAVPGSVTCQPITLGKVCDVTATGFPHQ